MARRPNLVYSWLLRVWNKLGEVGLTARVTAKIMVGHRARPGHLVEQTQRRRPQRQPAHSLGQDRHGRLRQLLRRTRLRGTSVEVLCTEWDS